MNDMKQDSRYEALYTQLLERGMDMHLNNKKRIKAGLILLILLPAILGIILKLTGSDKVFFLIVWVFCMFVICIYLITIEYIDDSIQKTLQEVTETETDFDELFAGTEQLGEKIAERHSRISAKIQTLRENRQGVKEKKGSPDAPESEGRE